MNAKEVLLDMLKGNKPQRLLNGGEIDPIIFDEIEKFNKENS